jgi:hypothetical protein
MSYRCRHPLSTAAMTAFFSRELLPISALEGDKVEEVENPPFSRHQADRFGASSLCALSPSMLPCDTPAMSPCNLRLRTA